MTSEKFSSIISSTRRSAARRTSEAGRALAAT
jgi:hypothetical protein